MDVEEKLQRLENNRLRIHAQPDLIRSTPHLVYEKLQSTIQNIPSKIYLTGCGDSYYCGLSTRMAFEEWTGVTAEALHALQFSRYTVQYAPEGSLVIAISKSGGVSRTVEAATYARDLGHWTLAITRDTDSPLNSVSESLLQLHYPDVGEGGGAGETLAYMASLIALYCLAIRLAECGGKISVEEAKELLFRIEKLSEIAKEAINSSHELMERFAQRISENAQMTVIGGGPNFGTALYGRAKIVEATHKNPIGQELEEWGHIQYYTTGPKTFTFVLAPLGRSIDRAREQIATIRKMNGIAIAVCDAKDRVTSELADLAVTIPFSEDELFTPITYCIPLQIFSYHFALAHKRIMLWGDDEIRREVNHQSLFHSNIPDWDLLSPRWNGEQE